MQAKIDAISSKKTQTVNFKNKYESKIWESIIKLSLRLLAILLLVILCIYAQSTVYNFPNTVPFEGKNIYNPYQNVIGHTVKANFHAHSIAWGGLTNGHNSADELWKSYRKKGYAFAGISNYFKYNSLNVSLRVYEHGLNIFKAHCLAINAKNISYFDFPIFQNTSHKQDIINRLRKNGAFVALAHPAIRGGHSIADMRELVGYNFTEVLNHYCVSDNEWDAALQMGKLSWIMANDDTHDINNEPSHQIWNEIYVNQTNDRDIIKAISEGKNYGIKTKNGTNDLTIKYLYVKNDTIYFDFGKNAKKVTIIINGKNKIEVNRGNGQIYFSKHNNYFRFVAESANSLLYTNPLVRFKGQKPLLAASFTPTINFNLTFIERVKFYILILFVFFWINRRSILKSTINKSIYKRVAGSPILFLLLLKN